MIERHCAPKAQNANVIPGDSFPEADNLSAALRAGATSVQCFAIPSKQQAWRLAGSLSKHSKPRLPTENDCHGWLRVVTSSVAAVAAASSGNPALAAHHRVSCTSCWLLPSALQLVSHKTPTQARKVTPQPHLRSSP